MTAKVRRKALRLGVVGAGGIARSRHLPALTNLADVEVIAVANARRETAEAVAREFGIQEVLNGWAEMVDRSDLDIIWISAPRSFMLP